MQAILLTTGRLKQTSIIQRVYFPSVHWTKSLFKCWLKWNRSLFLQLIFCLCSKTWRYVHWMWALIWTRVKGCAFETQMLCPNFSICVWSIKSNQSHLIRFNTNFTYFRNTQNEVKLADKEMYWRCWELLFCWSCINSKLFKDVHSTYPTLRMLFTMTISGYAISLYGIDFFKDVNISDMNISVII